MALADPVALSQAAGFVVSFCILFPSTLAAGSQFRQQHYYLGAAGLGSDAFRATMLAELGFGPPTSLSAALSGFYGTSDPERLLHAFTRRVSPLGHHDRASSARVVVAEATAGDPVARAIVQEHADRVVDYVSLCADRVGLGSYTQLPVVLGGSVLSAPDSLLRRLVVEALETALPDAQSVTTGAVPIRGAVLDAIAVKAAFSKTDSARVARAQLIETLEVRQEQLQPIADVLKPGLDVTKCRINNTNIIELVAQSTLTTTSPLAA